MVWIRVGSRGGEIFSFFLSFFGVEDPTLSDQCEIVVSFLTILRCAEDMSTTAGCRDVEGMRECECVCVLLNRYHGGLIMG